VHFYKDTQKLKSISTDFILAILLLAGVRTPLSEMNNLHYLFKIKNILLGLCILLRGKKVSSVHEI
jgi:hypothetical protein